MHMPHGGVIALLLATLSHLSAADFYVSPSGSDSNPGTLAAPFLTLTKARDTVRAATPGMTADITVYLRDGWYVLAVPFSLDQRDNGLNGHSVIYRAYAGAHPVLSGGTQLTGWTLYDAGKNIWRAPASGITALQLYVNSRRASLTRANRLPGTVVETGTGYTIPAFHEIQNWRNPADIQFVYTASEGGTAGAEWTERRVPVMSVSGNASSTTITMKSAAFSLAKTGGQPGQQISSSGPGHIENVFEKLQNPGEWYLDRAQGQAYYIPRSGESMASAIAIVPHLDSLMVGAGTTTQPLTNISFRGLTFANSTWLVPRDTLGFAEWQSNYCYTTVGSGSVSRTPGAVTIMTARNILFDGCVFSCIGSVGLDLYNGVQDSTVRGCRFAEISATALQLGKVTDEARSDTRLRDSNIHVLNNSFNSVPNEYHGGCAIMAGYVAHALIQHNLIQHTPYTGISLGWGWGSASYAQNNRVLNNRIEDIMEVLGDGGAWYALSPQPNSEMAYNWIRRSLHQNGRAIYPDEGSTGWNIHDNVSQNVQQWLYIWTSSIHDLVIDHNFSDSKISVNNGTNTQPTNTVWLQDTGVTAEAQAVMDLSGLEAAYSGVPSLPDPHLTPFGGAGGPGNVAPTCALSSPTNGATQAAPATISLAVNATDSDGTITKVEFFNGATKLAEDLASPYVYTWSGVAAGTYTLSARATDNSGAFTTSAAVSITVTGGGSGTGTSVFTAQTPADVNVTDGIDYELGMKFRANTAGTITAIRYYRGSSETGSHTGRLWTTGGTQLASVAFTGESATGWQQATLASPLAIAANTTFVVSVNANVFYAATSNGLANVITNGAVSSVADGANGVYIAPKATFPTQTFQNSNYFRDVVFIAGGGGGSNQPPTAALTAPTNGATFSAPASINLTATAADSDGTIAKVEFYQGATKLGEDTTSPYAYSWTGVTSGSYVLTVRAIDNGGATTTSAVVNIVVNSSGGGDTTPPATPAAPIINSATSPTPTVSGTTEANAVIRIYDNGTLIGQITANGSGVWSWTVSPSLVSGAHSVTVTATDSAGNVSAASPSATVTVAAGGGGGSASSKSDSGKCGLGSAVAVLGFMFLGLSLSLLSDRRRRIDLPK